MAKLEITFPEETVFEKTPFVQAHGWKEQHESDFLRKNKAKFAG